MDVNLLRKDAPSQKYIILHDAIANQPFGVSLWETGLENMNEWFIQWSWHLKQKEHMSYWQATWRLIEDFPETFIWEEWWRKGAWEIWGMNEECLKCNFEHLIFQKPLYWDGNAFLGMRQGLDLDLLQLAHHCEEQDRNFIWNWWYVQQRSCYGKTHSMATNGHHSAC